MFKAKNIMSTNIVTVKKNTAIYDAVKLMADKNFTGLPVVDDDMTLLGVVSEKDVMGLIKQPSNFCGTVERFMTSEPVRFDENDDLMEICECLIKNDFRRVPIVSKGKLVGIISRKDIIRYIAEAQ